MNLEELKEKYEIDLKKSVNEVNRSLMVNNILTNLKIADLITMITGGRYNGIVSFNKYSKQTILDKINIRMIEELEGVERASEGDYA